MKLLKKLFNLVRNRVFIVGLLLALQIIVIVSLAFISSESSGLVYGVLVVLSLLVAFWVISKDEDPPEFKIIWVVFIISAPVIGGLIYLIFGNRRIPKSLRRRLEESNLPLSPLFNDNTILPTDPDNQLQAKLIRNISDYPVFQNTEVEYFSLGETMYQKILEEMEKATKYICFEFFIIEDGVMLDGIIDIFERKIKEGVEVFFLYDDLGSIFNISKRAKKKLRSIGVKLEAFNKFRPRLNAMMNHRDHRKIVAIDGIVAFSGGVNIADEYINKIVRLGHWKDTGFMLRGEAAWALSLMFFQQWHFGTGHAIAFDHYRPKEYPETTSEGYVQVFGETPMDAYSLTESVYIKAIQMATDYICIASPYLIIDYALQEALSTAARSGVEVCLLLPHIYDKWYVHTLTTSHYNYLLRAGVKIYEYTPGFLHAKMFVADDKVGIVGTCNLDYRSFYHHFECSAIFYENPILTEVKKDLLEIREVSQEITIKEVESTRWTIKLLQYILKIFAPLM